MRRISGAILVVLTLVALAAAKEQETVEQLKARAEQAGPRDQVKLFMKIAELQVDAADKLYREGGYDQAKAAVEDAANYAEKSARGAMDINKDLKRTEIAVRKLASRLQAIWHTLAVEDRPPVQAATERMEKLDSRLLDFMFRKKK